MPYALKTSFERSLQSTWKFSKPIDNTRSPTTGPVPNADPEARPGHGMRVCCGLVAEHNPTASFVWESIHLVLACSRPLVDMRSLPKPLHTGYARVGCPRH